MNVSCWTRGPYALAATIVSVFESPTAMPMIAFSKPGTTIPLPSTKDNGSRLRDESNTVPSSRRPV